MIGVKKARRSQISLNIFLMIIVGCLNYIGQAKATPNVIHVDECINGDCTNVHQRVIYTNEVKLRERDLKVGLCLLGGANLESRIEKIENAFINVIDHNKKEDIINYHTISKLDKAYTDLIDNNTPIPCQRTIFSDHEYMKYCKNGMKKWARKNYCLTHEQIRRKNLYKK